MSIAALCRFFRDRKGNIAITFAFALIPALYLTGMSIDYISATQKKAKLDALADAAVLAALTPSMLHQTDATAQAAAQNVFQAQLPSIPGLNFDPKAGLTVTMSSNITTRNITVTYNASSQNYFPGVLKLNAINLTGTSKGSASFPPNIDFYLLLDNSPSMAIPATSAGITAMKNATIGQDGKGVGCAFACHQSNPSDLNPQNPGGVDNYQLAKNLGVSTRIQLVSSAVSQLTTTATNTAAQNKSTYRMALYTFNNAGADVVTPLTSSLTIVGSQAQNIDVMEVYKNNWITSTVNNSDADTDFGKAMSDINTAMPPPGTGLTGSSPQEILFLVSDGVDDANSPTPSCTQNLSGNRCQQMFNTTWCTTVKNRGIRIAVLYTVYLPMTSNSWYNNWVAPWQKWIDTPPQDKVSDNMQNCATPGLFKSVTTDGDIAAALNQLFQNAVQMAHLTQ